MRVTGSLEGIKNSILEALDQLFDIEIPQDKFWTEELITQMAELTGAINREIAIYIDRKGHIVDVNVGDFKTVNLNEVEGRRSRTRLTGIRCIHTHPNGVGQLSAVDISSLKLLRLDMMAAVGVAGTEARDIYVALPSPTVVDDTDVFGPYDAQKEDFEALLEYISDADDFLRKQSEILGGSIEKAVLVGLKTNDTRTIMGTSEADISMAELAELTDTAGATVVAQLIQKRDSRDAAFFVGKGKLEELRFMIQAEEADLVIFDAEITPSQQRNIEEILGVKVLDRTGLILDIFAQRARSREGKIQVELAQLEYILPRLTGQGVALSRLGGGIGTRGPGETKLETDRRHIRRRIDYLKEQLKEIKRQRGILRVERKKNRIPTVSLVGYTNAGKSSLLNALCKADVYAENKLFATLDTTTRRLDLDEKTQVLLTDTVGFIRKLPHDLLDAFKSTLEEAVNADAIIIVADSSDPYVVDHIRIVDEILAELGAVKKPTVIAYNKIDRQMALPSHKPIDQDRTIIEVSAITGEGFDTLKQCLKEMLYETKRRYDLRIPFQDGGILSWVYQNGNVLSVDYDENATLVSVELDEESAKRVQAYLVESPDN
jgi:GTP-binding protein HflX